ncbi:MAG: HAMP domain-containing sensor histidine kinase [Pseudomonadota bacterium]
MTGTGDTAAVRSGTSILRRQAIGLFVLILLLICAGAVALWGMRSSLQDLRRAEHSFRQLETARQLEAAFNQYLVFEVNRRLDGGGDPAESQAAADLRGALLSYRRRIGREIAEETSDQDRADERAEMVRASVLSNIFETIETEAMLDRMAGREFDSATSARTFLNNIARGRDEPFRAVIYEIIEDERHEADAAFAGLTETRTWLQLAGGALGFLLVTSVIVFTWLFHKGLMRPIRKLTRAAAAFGDGVLSTRAPNHLPGEFAALASQFNQMADRISGEQARLQKDVEDRTAELATANDELRRIDDTRRRFFANISHELRTPVTVLLGEAQLGVRSGSDPEEMRGSLERIVASGGFLRRRLDDLMRLARSEDGQLALSMADADLSEAALSAASIAEGYARAHDVALRSKVAGAIRLRGDQEAIRQATLALIDNAVKFSPPGGEIDVRTARKAGQAVLTVADQGPGFKGDDPERLLDRYTQESTGRAAGGTGLGLSIVKWIVDQHKGKVSVRNRKSGGAEFRLEFPL